MRVRAPQRPAQSVSAGRGKGYPDGSMGRDRAIVGVDPSSRKLAAVARFPGGHFERFTAQVSAAESKLRAATLDHLHTCFYLWLEELELADIEHYVWVEQPLFSRNVNTMRVISQVEAIALLVGLQMGAFGVYEVNVTTWKKDVVGRGNASKQDVERYLEAHHRDIHKLAAGDPDLLDAGAICLYGHEVVNRRAALDQRGVLEPGLA